MALHDAAACRCSVVSRPVPVSVEILELPPEHSGAACALFASVFGHPVDQAQWHWKYHAGPRLGQINMAARDDDGRWVGHAGAIVFPGVYGTRTLPMAQVCDIMVERGARGGFGRAGVYPRLVAALGEQLNARFPGVFAYGFPGTRPFTLGERLGYYRRLYVCAESRPRPPAPSRLPWRPWSVAEIDWHAPRLDRLWQRLSLALQAPTVARSGAYVAWRYRDRPAHAYRLWLLRYWFRDAGWLVTRAMPDGSHYVVDALLARPSDAAPACAALSRALAGGGNDPACIRTWLPLAGAQTVATPIVATEFLAGNWHAAWPSPRFQPGDTDVY